jgi:hypothetical protein
MRYFDASVARGSSCIGTPRFSRTWGSNSCEVGRDKRLVGVLSLGDLSQKSQRKAAERLKEISQPAAH